LIYFSAGKGKFKDEADNTRFKAMAATGNSENG
jgi:hypothetical protein